MDYRRAYLLLLEFKVDWRISNFENPIIINTIIKNSQYLLIKIKFFFIKLI